jgi:hypothetical protein
MITAAAICPCPPLLIRELTGQAEVLPELRAACAAAVARLAAAAPDILVVVGPGNETARWPAARRLDVTAYGPGTGAPGLLPGLPLSLGVGARLLDEAGYAGPRAFHGVAALARPAECLRLGGEIAASAPRVGLLAMGDGSARRSLAAPGYLDERAAPFDATVERAVSDGDLAALAAVDPQLAVDLLAGGRPAWQVLAGAFASLPVPAPAAAAAWPADSGTADSGTADSGAGRAVTEILYSGAPLGVAYLVACLLPR